MKTKKARPKREKPKTWKTEVIGRSPKLRDTAAPVNCPNCLSPQVALEERWEKWLHVRCRRCGESGPDFLDTQQAVAGWNKRAQNTVHAVNVDRDSVTCVCRKKIQVKWDAPPLR